MAQLAPYIRYCPGDAVPGSPATLPRPLAEVELRSDLAQCRKLLAIGVTIDHWPHLGCCQQPLHCVTE